MSSWKKIIDFNLADEYIYKASLSKYLYIAYSADKYELPIAFGYSLYELSILLGVSRDTLYRNFTRHTVNEKGFIVMKVYL